MMLRRNAVIRTYMSYPYSATRIRSLRSTPQLIVALRPRSRAAHKIRLLKTDLLKLHLFTVAQCTFDLVLQRARARGDDLSILLLARPVLQ